jgi:hypothetical protein
VRLRNLGANVLLSSRSARIVVTMGMPVLLYLVVLRRL